MTRCGEAGCVLKIRTKGHEFKETNTTKNRGAVKGTKRGESASFGTFLQQWLSLGVLEDLMRQTKDMESPVLRGAQGLPAEEERRAHIKGMNDSAMALFAESITRARDQIQVTSRQAADDKAAMEESLATSDRAREALLQNIKVMKKNL